MMSSRGHIKGDCNDTIPKGKLEYRYETCLLVVWYESLIVVWNIHNSRDKREGGRIRQLISIGRDAGDGKGKR